MHSQQQLYCGKLKITQLENATPPFHTPFANNRYESHATLINMTMQILGLHEKLRFRWVNDSQRGLLKELSK